MESKTFARIAAIGGLVVICGLCGLTAYGTVSWLRGGVGAWDVFEGPGQSAAVTEEMAFSIAPVLEVTTDYGDIRVTAADVDRIEVEVVKTAWGANQEEAEAAADALSIEVVELNDRLKLVFHRPDTPEFRWIDAPESVDFIVRVPMETAVDLNTSFGEIEISGLAADAEIKSDFGRLDVTDHTGGLSASSSNAAVSVTGLDAGEGKVDIDTSFGDITLENVTAGEFTVHTSNGSISIQSVTALNGVTIENQFGAVEVFSITAMALQIDNQNGPIRVQGGAVADQISADNEFGDIDVSGVQAPVFLLSTANGDVNLVGASGSVTVENSFGGISITDAVDVTLDLKSGNGPIEFSGSLAAAAHSLHNSFGDISLTIPAGSAFNVTLKTEFGDIHSEIPLTLTGSLDSGSNSDQWDAEMNGGGPLLDAETSNGDISIHVLQTAGE